MMHNDEPQHDPLHVIQAASPAEAPEAYRSGMTSLLVLSEKIPRDEQLDLMLNITADVAGPMLMVGMNTTRQLLEWVARHLSEEHGVPTTALEVWQMLLLRSELGEL